MQKSRPSGVCRRESASKYRRFREKKDARSVINEYEQDEEEGRQPEDKPEQKDADKYRGRGRKRKEKPENKQKQAAQVIEKPKSAEDFIGILLGEGKKKSKNSRKDKKKNNAGKKKPNPRRSRFQQELHERIRICKEARRVIIEDDAKCEDKKDAEEKDKE